MENLENRFLHKFKYLEIHFFSIKNVVWIKWSQSAEMNHIITVHGHSIRRHKLSRKEILNNSVCWEAQSSAVCYCWFREILERWRKQIDWVIKSLKSTQSWSNNNLFGFKYSPLGASNTSWSIVDQKCEVKHYNTRNRQLSNMCSWGGR